MGTPVYKVRTAMKEKKVGKAGHVYVCSLGHDNLYKIGMTTNLTSRLRALSASNPQLRCVFSAMTSDARKAEKALHRIYKDCRVEREIFKIRNVDTKWLSRLIVKYYQQELTNG
jgi:hypothetical protein